MITIINGKTFFEKPRSCNECPFFFYPGRLNRSSIGICTLFNENHNFYISPPKRCQKLFNKAFRMPEGSNLVIVINEEKKEEL